MREPIICIDAGHGDDSGCEYYDIKEDDYVWGFVHDLIHRLESWPLHVELTRVNGQSLSLADRAAIAMDKKADLYLSFHLNANNRSDLHGGMLFHRHGDTIANMVCQQIAYAQPYRLKRTKKVYQASRMEWKRVFECIYRLHCPAILYELGFLSNEGDSNLLKSEHIRLGLQSAVMCGIAMFLGIGNE